MWFYSPLAEHSVIEVVIPQFRIHKRSPPSHDNSIHSAIEISGVALPVLKCYGNLLNIKESYSIVLSTTHDNSLKQVKWKNWPQS